ncbi:MAG: polyphosphate kinase 2 [Rhodothermia bacterium]|nr:MAG: polyphosphate kinase 2 [Rhodothermia bacterium]
MKKKSYEKELAKLHLKLTTLQRCITRHDLRVAVLFEGRDAAGKGGAIKRITQVMNPRVCRVVALNKPTERESAQWYFQRYVTHLPAEGEIVLFDRSWYNRAGVEKVMGFCSEEQYQDFLKACPNFERMLVRSGIILIKYWFSVSAEEQERRLRDRLKDPTKRWKLTQIDLASRLKWSEYSKAESIMLANTDTEECPWSIVRADNKRQARLNCIHHLLQQIPYEDLPPEEIDFPARPEDEPSEKPPLQDQEFIPEVY